MKVLSQRSSDYQVDFPYFRPEINESSKWVSQVQQISSELGWTDVQILTRIGRFLLNDSRKWFDV